MAANSNGVCRRLQPNAVTERKPAGTSGPLLLSLRRGKRIGLRPLFGLYFLRWLWFLRGRGALLSPYIQHHRQDDEEKGEKSAAFGHATLIPQSARCTSCGLL